MGFWGMDAHCRSLCTRQAGPVTDAGDMPPSGVCQASRHEPPFPLLPSCGVRGAGSRSQAPISDSALGAGKGDLGPGRSPRDSLLFACVRSAPSAVSDSLWPHGLKPARLLRPGILQARTLERVAMPCSRGSSQPRGRTRVSCVPCTGRRVPYHVHHLGSLFVLCFW